MLRRQPTLATQRIICYLQCHPLIDYFILENITNKLCPYSTKLQFRSSGLSKNIGYIVNFSNFTLGYILSTFQPLNPLV